MSFRPRDEPHAIWHVTGRVNWQEWHLVSASAYEKFVHALALAAREHEVDILAFVVMSNHFHVVSQSPDEDEYRRRTSRRTKCGHLRPYRRGSPRSTVLGQFTRQFMLHAANSIQEELGLKGHFWEARHHRRRVADARQLVFTIAYDHRNPARAGLCARPEHFPRSSAAWWSGRGPSDVHLATRAQPLFGLDLETIRQAVLEYQESRALDDVARAFAKTGLRMDSPRGAARFASLLDESGLRPVQSAALPIEH